MRVLGGASYSSISVEVVEVVKKVLFIADNGTLSTSSSKSESSYQTSHS